MDRASGQLDRVEEPLGSPEDPFLGLGEGDEYLLRQSARHASIDRQLFELAELDCLYQVEVATLWTFMRPAGRPSFTPAMLHDFEDWQRLIVENFGPGQVPLHYLVLGSRTPG